MNDDIRTVEQLEAVWRAARRTGEQFHPRFRSCVYAYEMPGVDVAEAGYRLVKVGIAGVLALGERLDKELAGANDEILHWLRAGAQGSPRSLSAHGVMAIPDRPASLILLEQIDVAFEHEYRRAFGATLGDAVYMPLAQRTIDRAIEAAAALPFPELPEPPTPPESDELFAAALEGIHELHSAKKCVPLKDAGPRRAYYARVRAYLAAARNADLDTVGAEFAAPDAADGAPVGALVYFISGPLSNRPHGCALAGALHKRMMDLKPLIEARIKRAKTLAARAAAAALALHPAAQLDAGKFRLPVDGPVSWTSVLGATAADGLGPTELVVATTARIAAARAGGAVALHTPLADPTPARVTLTVNGVAHTFAPAPA